MTRALIIGDRGQDGTLLWDLLSSRGYDLLGAGRGIARRSDGSAAPPLDINSTQQVLDCIKGFDPDEIYYLAAHHRSAEQQPGERDATDISASFAVHVHGLLNVLDAMQATGGRGRLFYAGSCHVFGDAPPSPQTERTPLDPTCPYGITKASGMRLCRFYRQRHGLHVSAGILYNHESPLRSERFVSQKIARAAARLARGQDGSLLLGDLSATIDWGWAPDFVEAIVRIVQLPQPLDFIISTGEAHSVSDFARIAFASVGADWRQCVGQDPSLTVRTRLGLIGDSSLLRKLTGWRPSVSFEQMVQRMVHSAIESTTTE